MNNSPCITSENSNIDIDINRILLDLGVKVDQTNSFSQKPINNIVYETKHYNIADKLYDEKNVSSVSATDNKKKQGLLATILNYPPIFSLLATIDLLFGVLILLPILLTFKAVLSILPWQQEEQEEQEEREEQEEQEEEKFNIFGFSIFGIFKILLLFYLILYF